MPRKGRKYQNDEKVLDRLKIPINIIKCKKNLNLIKQDGKQQRAEEFPTRPHHLGKARKKVKTCKKSTNSQNVFLWSRMNFFSWIWFSRSQAFYSILPVSPTLYRKYEIFVEISVERGLLIIYKSGQATKKQYQKLTVVC